MNFKLLTELCTLQCVGFLLLSCIPGSRGVVNKKNKFLVTERSSIVFPDTDISIFPSNNNKPNAIPPVIEGKKELDPCEKFVPPRIRFSGGRVSARKCAEYMSQMINRDLVTDRAEKCRIKQGKTSPTRKRIIMSKYDTKPAQFPHMAAVGWRIKESNKWAFNCGGSLISPSFVLTAAHCASVVNIYLNLASSEPEIVRLGTRNIQRSKYETPVDVKIKRIIKHPYWDPTKRYYDIALIELETPVQFSKFVQPACLPDKFFTSKTNATITGWGVTDVNLLTSSSILQLGHVDIIESKLCDKLVHMYHDRHWWGLMDHQICAGKIQGGVDTCKGDSGGPLQIQLKETNFEGTMHMVIGVTSFGVQRDRCGVKEQPGIYTKVSSFLDWIESIVW